ncbi:antibiotic ABC transporter ATP-binding protein [Streptomyces solicathayae]|uniref:Antibiotic ABC transporter ATP-binding protein n=1 Tax=Streptomyces solicathayae TaxID=3081768 RepID=A0ABZ0LT46_9ACTN|nr:antibiotic ABC transporter ATP-binding protein [Streptomyces sp. HUAS YS2]WOX22475.1 antibiotic ABC transporter ATP-binding protein [Streptomyces sp. HUAS YS2]
MARVVVVHGIGQEFLGPEQMRGTAVPALLDGVHLAGHAAPAAEDVDCAFYGDLYLEPGSRSDDLPPWDEFDVEDGLETELLDAWWAAADPERGAEEGTRGFAGFTASRALLSERVRAALDALAGTRYFGKVSDRLLILALKQVRRYLTEPDLRAAAQERVASRIGPDTRVVVAHSLGSVVAYETLCARPDLPVTDLVTIGSPLGLRRIVFDRLAPLPVDGRACWPGAVTRWTNLADHGDIVALPARLAPRFGDTVTDDRIDNGTRMHDLARYLSAPKTGAAVARGLR